MFNSNPEFIEIGIPAFRKVSISYMFMALNVIGAGTFQALGRGSPSLVITFLRQALIFFAIYVFFGQIGGLNSTWFAFPIAESIAFSVNITWIILLLKKCMREMKYENMQKEYVKQE